MIEVRFAKSQCLCDFLNRAIDVFPQHDKAFTILMDDCKHYQPQFETFYDVGEAICLLCSTPVFVMLNATQYRDVIERLLLVNVEFYLHPVIAN